MSNKNFAIMQEDIKKTSYGTYEEFEKEVNHNKKLFIEKLNRS